VRVDACWPGRSGQGQPGQAAQGRGALQHLNAIAAEGQKLLTDVRKGNGTLSKLIYDDKLYQEVRAPLQRVDAILADLQAGQGTVGKLLKDPALFDEAKQTARGIHKLLAELNAGKGTAGKLMKDEQLYGSGRAGAKLNGTLDKISAGQGTVGQFW
jgi:phospholipid/cholesterol/gamma-HCH transport system substrate-binding protein